MIEFLKVSFQYDKEHALHQVNAIIPKHQTSLIIGPSGCGKSTMLKMLAGLIIPTGGQIRIEDQLLQSSFLPQWRLRLGYVIQEGGLFPHMTVRQNTTLMANHLKWPSAKVESRMHELSELTQIPKKFWDRYPVELSGGQRQRVSLMRALMLDPDVLLLDEPLAALDPMIRYDLQKQLKTIFRKLQKTVIMVSHDLAEAAYLSHQVILLKKGQVVQHGEFESLVKQPKNPFVGEFLHAQQQPAQALMRFFQ